ncbi:MAG: hypothetical protein JJ992_06385, partial [Planctomycetes bacterium]|nr:hypothetical protein [Planctomycetota bacterium]
MLVGLLMLVMILMQEARKADNWRWMWYLQGQTIGTGGDRDAVDTRLREPASTPSGFGPLVMGNDAAEGGRGEVESRGMLHPSHSEGNDIQLEDAVVAAWTKLLDGISDGSRRLLLTGLKSARDGVDLPEDERAEWFALVDQLDAGWQAYLAESRKAVEDDKTQLNPDEQRRWEGVVAKLQQQWDERWRPALRALGNSSPPTPEDKEALDQVQAGLDKVFLNS